MNKIKCISIGLLLASLTIPAFARGNLVLCQDQRYWQNEAAMAQYQSCVSSCVGMTGTALTTCQNDCEIEYSLALIQAEEDFAACMFGSE